MQASDSPTKIQVPFANSGTKHTIPIPSQIGITNGAASFTDGFPPLTFAPLTAGGIPPSGADFNGIFNAITAIQRWQSAGGVFKYDSAFSAAVGGYPKGCLLATATGDGFWISTADNNTTNPDGSSPEYWKLIPSWSDIISGIVSAKSISASGYIKFTSAFLDGFCVQWGNGIIPAFSPPLLVNFPAPDGDGFNTACYGVLAQRLDTGSTGPSSPGEIAYIITSSPTTSSFEIDNDPGTHDIPFYWMAIGK